MPLYEDRRFQRQRRMTMPNVLDEAYTGEREEFYEDYWQMEEDRGE